MFARSQRLISAMSPSPTRARSLTLEELHEELLLWLRLVTHLLSACFVIRDVKSVTGTSKLVKATR